MSDMYDAAREIQWPIRQLVEGQPSQRERIFTAVLTGLIAGRDWEVSHNQKFYVGHALAITDEAIKQLTGGSPE